jgi:tetratricopeptide (TPR) repeat protein
MTRETGKPSRRRWLATTATLVATLAMWLIAAFSHSNWLWGVNLLACLPPALGIAVAALAVAGAIPGLSTVLGRLLDRLGTGGARRGLVVDIMVGAGLGVLLFAFARDPVRFFGDSNLRLGLLSTNLPAHQLFPQAFPLDVVINAQLARALIAVGVPAPEALQLLGSAMAALYVIISLRVVREAGAVARAVPAAALVALGGACLVALPGYGKFGPLLLGMGLATMGTLRLSRDGSGVWHLAIGLSIALLSHRTAFAVLPAAALTFGLAIRSCSRAPERARLVAAAAIVALVALAMLPSALHVLLRFDIGTQGALSGTRGGAAAVPSLAARLADAANLLFFLVPLWPVGIAAAWVVARGAIASRRRRGFSIAPVAALAIGAQLAIAIASRSQQGAARDWDIHLALGSTAGLAASAFIARASQLGDYLRFHVALTTAALALGLMVWVVSIDERAQLSRIQLLLESTPPWTAEATARARDFLGIRAFNLGRYDESAMHFERAISAAPNPRYYYQAGLARWRAGELDESQRLEREALRRAPHNGDPWWVLSAITWSQGDSVAAAACADSARARGVSRPAAGIYPR